VFSTSLICYAFDNTYFHCCLCVFSQIKIVFIFKKMSFFKYFYFFLRFGFASVIEAASESSKWKSPSSSKASSTAAPAPVSAPPRRSLGAPAPTRGCLRIDLREGSLRCWDSELGPGRDVCDECPSLGSERRDVEASPSPVDDFLWRRAFLSSVVAVATRDFEDEEVLSRRGFSFCRVASSLGVSCDVSWRCDGSCDASRRCDDDSCRCDDDSWCCDDSPWRFLAGLIGCLLFDEELGFSWREWRWWPSSRSPPRWLGPAINKNYC